MAQGSTRFEHLEKSIDDYIIEQQNKNTTAKTTRDVKLLIEYNNIIKYLYSAYTFKF